MTEREEKEQKGSEAIVTYWLSITIEDAIDDDDAREKADKFLQEMCDDGSVGGEISEMSEVDWS